LIPGSCWAIKILLQIVIALTFDFFGSNSISTQLITLVIFHIHLQIWLGITPAHLNPKNGGHPYKTTNLKDYTEQGSGRLFDKALQALHTMLAVQNDRFIS
jgi:hypothetical protein